MKDEANVIVGCIYKHPHMNVDDFLSNYFAPFLQEISKENKRLFLLGDFNINLLNHETDNSVKHFVDIFESSLLLPSILLPTRVTTNTSTLIDNIFFTPTKYKISSGNFLTGISDHLPQYLILEQNDQRFLPKSIQYRDWKRFDKEKFTSEFRNLDWNNLLSLDEQDPNTAFDNFFNCINGLINLHAPIKTMSWRKLKKSS